MFGSYFSESIIKRAVKRGILDIRVHDLRKWTKNKRRTVDDRPFGGGPGMVMVVEPFYRALKSLHVGRSRTQRVILLSAKGKVFTHKDAVRLSKYKRLILLCGRYEGVDERVAKKLADEELSIGEYVLTGGELPAMVVIDAVARQVKGVLSKEESLKTESFTKEGVTEHPQYTRPEVFEPKKGTKWRVPKVLLSGDHKKIKEWRSKKSKKR